MFNNIKNEINVTLIGNPNVGKSSIFNALTGSHQHTGNWSGKTVDNAVGYTKSEKNLYKIVDLPGTYSIDSGIGEEKFAEQELLSSDNKIIAVICDATCLERSLILAQKIIDNYNNVLIILNLMDEAKKKGIAINQEKLSNELNVKIISVCAKDKKCKEIITDALDNISDNLNEKNAKDNSQNKSPSEYILNAKDLYSRSVVCKTDYTKSDRQIDRIITHKYFSYPIMLIFLTLIFWLSIAGANYPSQLLSRAFMYLGTYMRGFLSEINTPQFIVGILIDGIYRVLSWVISVMLPPMAIFFSLFTLLEDIGFLPRVAYNLDRPFSLCGSCGKQSLTMCMGIGCNAVGVCGARIINSKRERMIAIITNSFIPCNGRFPSIIAISSIFLASSSTASKQSLLCALLLTLFILLSVIMTMITTYLLSKIILKTDEYPYTLELPPYRMPQLTRTIARALLDKTVIVLIRAVCVAAPAGLLIYLVSNLKISNISILSYLSELLTPIGRFIALDGAILLAFILGMPANEIVLPILLMIYLAQGTLIEFKDITELKSVLIDNGWSLLTAINFIIFSMFHFPCSTTLISIYKETKSKKYTFFAFAIPLLIGILLCLINRFIFWLFT